MRIVAADLRQTGRFDEAISLIQKGLAAAPDEAPLWADLAGTLFAAARPEVSLAAWDRAARLRPDSTFILSGRARVLHSVSRVEEAAMHYRRALSLEPGSQEARFGLARLAFEAGRLAEAQEFVSELLALEPPPMDVQWLAARIALGRGDAPAAIARFRRLLASPRLDPAQRAETLLGLGEALDAAGQAPEAFAVALEGKAIQRRLFAQRAAGRESETARLERLARGHPAIVTLEEAPTLAAPQAEFLGSAEGCERLARIGADEAGGWRRRYWTEVAARGVDPTGLVFLDKAPAGTLRLPLVAKLFPKARVLFAIRDPRDVVLSCLRNAFQMNAMTYAFTDLEETAACYRANMELAEVYRGVLPLELMEVRHETLVEDFDGELARIAAFIGVTFEPRMGDVAATAAHRVVRTPSGPQVRAGLNRRGLARWRAYAAELAPVMATLTPWVRRFGYGA